ncbi:DUF4255 domain-containing protein [Synechococcus sp. PCC 7336]|uniref:DUF4255 domain-containing protein n=1 Tax=Synechococcus sp. PCC 7336 TaxID=195250 RepID=UPI0003470306|nr:DUF4255 domain-containing protein [Synechococcus sp. PCC 7336]
MSNSLALAAVTTTLQNPIFLGIRDELGSGRITALPLDKARSNSEGNQVNLFLYHTAPNVAWGNIPKPVQAKRGTTEKPPLGLDLYFLIAAYGENDSEVKSHRLLGRVMSILHDHPYLDPTEIEAATATELPKSDLHQQVERITITPQSLTFEEMSQVWRVFQAQYRASVAYQVSVVLIDSRLSLDLALPVLPRLPEERGASAQVGIGGPRLQEVSLPNRQRSAQWGNTLTIRGSDLDRPEIAVRLSHPRLSEPIVLTPLPERTESELRVQLPNLVDSPQAAIQWLAGFYTLSLTMPRDRGSWSTDALPLAIAPQVLTVAPLTAPVGSLTLTLTCVPQIQPEREVLLLFGDRGIPVLEIEPAPDGTQPTTLRVQIPDVRPGVYVVRLRVDGVDSIPVDFTARPPEFAANQTVAITA